MFIESIESKFFLSLFIIACAVVFICIGIYIHNLIIWSLSCLLFFLSFIFYSYVLRLDKERVEKNRINKKEVSHEQG